jgi:hypothetical protein
MAHAPLVPVFVVPVPVVVGDVVVALGVVGDPPQPAMATPADPSTPNTSRLLKLFEIIRFPASTIY